ncbi:CDGSH iron-sulfur domain-containing protein [Natrarchaeobius chitinivorans]|uniref:CDGSH iron-sulfur domain-containing protein n=1 Tax=Natrarchaeobius chitinivorans TaxID=1679083 RepID=A0A3N6PDS5_NATCH|nr:CDGSH iron-sulfur domain-containing protein [Natrarchaeobius chitinivorans]RQG95225.1 CDGSH iron-sulfur domain-containing protein [Natrarchaeobius chitinivorans]
MSRLVELEATGPRKLDPEDIDGEKGDVAICQCGLSASFPFCDGSHRRTADEDGNTVYVYENGKRSAVERVVTVDADDAVGTDNDDTDPTDTWTADR